MPVLDELLCCGISEGGIQPLGLVDVFVDICACRMSRQKELKCLGEETVCTTSLYI